MPIFARDRQTGYKSSLATAARRTSPAHPKFSQGSGAMQAKREAAASGQAGLGTTASFLVGDTLQSSGQPLEPATRTFMESRFGHDFSHVRVHADDRAAESAHAIEASAYTSGHNVVFGRGRYQPSSPGGRLLLAHELAHVVQQEAGVHLPGGVSHQGDRHEQQADAASRQVNNGESLTAPGKDLAIPTAGRLAGGNSFGAPIQRQHESAGPGVQDTAGHDTKITRPEQVLNEYGMTCYGTAVMYMVQSYGLVPPDMTREEFEYAFSPLNPSASDHKAAKTDDIKVAGTEQKGAKPVDLITKALEGTDRPSKRSSSLGQVTTTEATLRGADKGSMRVSDIMAHMPAILKAFQEQSRKPGFEFMKAHVPSSGKALALSGKDKWIESSKEVASGAIPGDYFADGNTVMAGVSMRFPSDGHLDHWVVIVKEPEKKDVGGRTVFLWPADDPLSGNPVFVAAPNVAKATDDTLRGTGISAGGSYSSRSVYTLLPSFAFRRNISIKP